MDTNEAYGYKGVTSPRIDKYVRWTTGYNYRTCDEVRTLLHLLVSNRRVWQYLLLKRLGNGNILPQRDMNACGVVASCRSYSTPTLCVAAAAATGKHCTATSTEVRLSAAAVSSCRDSARCLATTWALWACVCPMIGRLADETRARARARCC